MKTLKYNADAAIQHIRSAAAAATEGEAAPFLRFLCQGLNLGKLRQLRIDFIGTSSNIITIHKLNDTISLSLDNGKDPQSMMHSVLDVLNRAQDKSLKVFYTQDLLEVLDNIFSVENSKIPSAQKLSDLCSNPFFSPNGDSCEVVGKDIDEARLHKIRALVSEWANQDQDEDQDMSASTVANIHYIWINQYAHNLSNDVAAVYSSE